MRRPTDAARAARLAGWTLVAFLLAACGSVPQRASAPVAAPIAVKPSAPEQDLPALPAASSGHGAYYQDDGPGEHPPPDLKDVPDADVHNEPYSTHSNRPYVVFGKSYVPLLNEEPFSEHGLASWYGKKFHGQRTSSGEIYDMYKMTAAHPTLPIPSYARVTSLVNGKQVVVRINDRGPFHPGRVIDVSYTAALKLGLLGAGSNEVKVERILPAEIDAILAARAKRAEAAKDGPPAAPEIVALMNGDGETAPNEDEKDATQAVAEAPAGSFYLQLGAFKRADMANAARVKLSKYGGVLGTLKVMHGGAVHRLLGGPFATRSAASQAAQDLPTSLNIKPIIVKR